MKTALLIGGTAAGGTAIYRELQDRGFDVTVYHRGTHEAPQLVDAEHIHGDPHFADAIAKDLGQRQWDVTVASYGRLRYLVEAMRGRTGHFVAIGGLPTVQQFPGLPFTEDGSPEDVESAPPGIAGLLPKMFATEHAVLDAHRTGYFRATIVRYPYVYGPHGVAAAEWQIVKRVFDRRQRWVIQGDGLQVRGRCASPNAARLVGCVVDYPDIAGGEIYHAADNRQYSQREWVEMVAAILGYEFEFVDIPASVASFGRSCVPMSGDTIMSGRLPDLREGRLRHSVPSNSKATSHLGYEEAVAPEDWLIPTVDYLRSHQPVGQGVGGTEALEFDYAAEDVLLHWWDSVVRSAPSLGKPVVRVHPYDHPKSSSESSAASEL